MSSRSAIVASLLWSLASTFVAADVCSTLANQTSIEVRYPLTLEYMAEQQRYWSTSSTALEPSCILYPTTTSEVSAIIAALRNSDSPERFAIKSGGHNPNDYFSSIDGGPIISTNKLNKAVAFDKEAKTARISPGLTWTEVAEAFDGTGFTAVGGRVGDVGVGGYLVGGGLSFLSTQHGWAVDSVVKFELVLANATVVNVTAASHPDLFLSLRGGGNVFGIVTAFEIRVHPQDHDIYGGMVLYPADAQTSAKLIAALHRFASSYPDPKAAITFSRQGGAVDGWVILAYYDGPKPPAGVFDDFDAVVPLMDTRATQSHASLMKATEALTIHGTNLHIGTETYPLPSEAANGTGNGTADAGLEMINFSVKLFDDVSRRVATVPGLSLTMSFQPIPRAMAKITRCKGGNLLDFDDEVDRIVMEFNYASALPADTDVMDKEVQWTYESLQRKTQELTAAGRLPKAHLPLFMNDAHYKQDFFGRLRPEKAELAREVGSEVDPEGFFRDRTGGFKL